MDFLANPLTGLEPIILSTSVAAFAERIYRIRRTTLQMLRDRGYLINVKTLNETQDQFKQTFRETNYTEKNTPFILTAKKKDHSKGLIVFYYKGKSSGVKEVRAYYQRVKEANEKQTDSVLLNIKTMIIIWEIQLASHAAQTLIKQNNENKSFVRIEQFIETQLLINISEHSLVPPHVKLSKTQKIALLTRYKLMPSQLPRIQSTDAMARYLGLKIGDVVKITRPSETAGRYTTYRIAVLGN